MKFNLRAALESRPFEDQDLEDTAKPAPDAGQIDGDTTTLSGMAKPGQNPVPDKIDTRPVDLDDVVLAEQDRRAYEPLATDQATHDAIVAQNIATEGWLSKTVEKIGDFFTHREHDIEAGYTSLVANLKAIARMRERIVARAGEVNVGGDPVSLSKHAKWLAIDGKLIDDPAKLIRELQRLEKFITWSVKNYTKSIDAMYKFTAQNVLKLGESDLDKALENSKQIIAKHYPQGADAWLTVKDVVKWKDKNYEDRHMPYLLGQWGLVGLSQEQDTPVPGVVLRVVRHTDSMKVKKGEFKPLPKDAMKQILDICERIENTFAANKADGDAIDRYFDAMDEFAYRYRYWNQLSKEEQKKVSQLYSASKVVAVNDFSIWPLSYSNHLVKVLLMYIEKSLRRVEQA